MIVADGFSYPGYVHCDGLVYHLQSPGAQPVVLGFASREPPHVLQFVPGYHPRGSAWESGQWLLKYAHWRPYVRLPEHTDRPLDSTWTSTTLLWERTE